MTEDDKTRYQLTAQYHDHNKKYPKVRSFFWLLSCADALDKYADKEVGKFGNNRTGLVVLQILLKYLDGISQQGIAEQIGRTKQAVVASIDKLEQKGLVVRCSNDHDRRVNSIRITQAGISFLNEVFPDTLNMCEEAYCCLSDEEIEQLLKLTVKLTTNLWEKMGVPFIGNK